MEEHDDLRKMIFEELARQDQENKRPFRSWGETERMRNDLAKIVENYLGEEAHNDAEKGYLSFTHVEDLSSYVLKTPGDFDFQKGKYPFDEENPVEMKTNVRSFGILRDIVDRFLNNDAEKLAKDDKITFEECQELADFIDKDLDRDYHIRKNEWPWGEEEEEEENEEVEAEESEQIHRGFRR